MFLNLFVHVLFYLEWQTLVILFYFIILSAFLQEFNHVELTVYSGAPVSVLKARPAHYHL